MSVLYHGGGQQNTERDEPFTEHKNENKLRRNIGNESYQNCNQKNYLGMGLDKSAQIIIVSSHMGEPDGEKGPQKYPPDMFFEQMFPDVILQIVQQGSLIPVINQRMAFKFMADFKSVNY